MSNVMATVEKIVCTYAIEGADAIEMAQVLDYHVVVKKGEFNKGDYVVYARVDSIFPDGVTPENLAKYTSLKKSLSSVTDDLTKRVIEDDMLEVLATSIHPEYEFLRSAKFRIKAKKYNKFKNVAGQSVVSQGIIFGASILPAELEKTEGIDVTEVLSITKVLEDPDEVLGEETDEDDTSSKPFVKWLDRRFMRYAIYRRLRAEFKPSKIKGTWAEWMPSKSDEENAQKLYTWLLNKYGDRTNWYVTEKMEGQSMAVYVKTETSLFGFKNTVHHGVCSRNIHMPKNNGSAFWNNALKLDLFSKIKKANKNLYVRGEQCGPGIQGNIYEFTGPRFFVYEVWDIDLRRKYNYAELTEFCTTYGFEMCPVVATNFKLPENIQSILAYVDGKSTMAEVWREGYVFRLDDDSEVSFKGKSPEYELRKGGSKAYPGKPIK